MSFEDDHIEKRSFVEDEEEEEEEVEKEQLQEDAMVECVVKPCQCVESEDVPLYSLPCGHYVHKECIFWGVINNNGRVFDCPSCEDNQLSQIFATLLSARQSHEKSKNVRGGGRYLSTTAAIKQQQQPQRIERLRAARTIPSPVVAKAPRPETYLQQDPKSLYGRNKISQGGLTSRLYDKKAREETENASEKMRAMSMRAARQRQMEVSTATRGRMTGYTKGKAAASKKRLTRRERPVTEPEEDHYGDEEYFY